MWQLIFISGEDCDAEELLCELKEAVEHTWELEVGAQIFRRESEQLLAHAFGPVGNVPVHEWLGLTMRGGKGAHGFELGSGGRMGGGAQPRNERIDGVYLASHCCGKADLGMGRIAQQLGQVGAKRKDGVDQPGIVCLAGGCARHIGAVDRLALAETKGEGNDLGLQSIVGLTPRGRVHDAVQVLDDSPCELEGLKQYTEGHDCAIPCGCNLTLKGEKGLFGLGQDVADSRFCVVWGDLVELRQCMVVQQWVG